MQVTIPIYQAKFGNWMDWTTVGLGECTVTSGGKSAIKIQERVTQLLKAKIRELEPEKLALFQMSRGTELTRLRLDLTLRGEGERRRLSGKFPLILEPRWINSQTRVTIAYHPTRQDEWFFASTERPLEELATTYFQKTWKELDEEELDDLKTDGKDLLKTFAFTAQPKLLLDRLPDRKKGIWDDLELDKLHKSKPRKRGGLKVLGDLGVDQTTRVVGGSLPLGTPRSPYREQLHHLLCGRHRCSVILLGPSGVGKTTLVYRWIADLLAADDFPSHRNLDRVHHVWSVAGRRIIAGMSYLGDWEQRCIELLEDASRQKVILHVEDIAAFGRIGRTRDSDRNLAEFFRGPISRGDLTMVGECTAEQLQRLEDDAPSFAALFTLVRVQPTTDGETLQLMIHAARELEQRHWTRFDPLVYRSVLELGGSLFPGEAFPGKALTMVRDLARQCEGERTAAGEVKPGAVIRHLSMRTGLPEHLLEPKGKLAPSDVAAELSRYVKGQPVAVAAATDLILRIRAGATDPRRPYGVYLFTGPTGTGKTELSRCISEYLYGDQRRLIRLDMSEYGTADSAARLIGDRYVPKGLLTEQVLEHPFCLVLFDEIEKAHPSVLNLLLQLFDDGRLTDAAGNTADFTHAVVIMTSNLGARRRSPVGFGEHEHELQHDIERAVKEFFPPELFNRIDRVVRFSSLTVDTARGIAKKELRALLGRRGLSDRNILVYAGQSVINRVVREGFDPQYGARTVKKYLEDQIGGLLADQIASGPSASMQIFHLYEGRLAGEDASDSEDARDTTIRLHVEGLTEVSTIEAPLAIEPLLELPVTELRQKLPEALDFLDDLLSEELLTDLSERIGHHLQRHQADGSEQHAEAAYTLDSLRTDLTQLRGRTGYLLSATRYDRPAILECLASAHFMRRAIANVDDPSYHSIFIEILKVGRADPKRRFRSDRLCLLQELARIYADKGRGEVEEFAVGHGEEGVATRGELGSLLASKEPDLVVLKVVGLNVLDFYEGEEGCHIWESLAYGSQIARVRIFPAAPEISAASLVRQHRDGVRAFDEALERGGELPPNPRRLMPAVRKLRFDPALNAGDMAPVEIEDYLLGTSEIAHVKELLAPIPRLWMLRMSRMSADETTEDEVS